MTETMIPVAGTGGDDSQDTSAFLAVVPRRLRRRDVRSPLTRDTVGGLEHATCSAPVEAEEGLRLVQELWDVAVAEGPLQARKHRALAALWNGGEEDPELSPDGDLESPTAAWALRISLGAARFAIRDAHHAIDTFPECFSLLEGAAFPAPWFSGMLRGTRHLQDSSRRGIDAVIAEWDLRIPQEAFRRRLGQLIAWVEQLEAREILPPPVERTVFVGETVQGMTSLQVHGPAPEVLSLARRLDVAARAVQTAQKAALETGAPIPLDPDGMAAEAQAPLRLDTLRYLLLTQAEFDTDGVSVPADRFRIAMTVPAMTLLGASDAPGMLDGVTPIPADLARRIAGGENAWYRVLTDPSTGAYLPLAADRYRPTPAQLEHLRLVSPQCAVPGCARITSWASQCDHIEEYDHRDPWRGGVTAIDNLHLLCLHHHQEKTAGRIDPVRLNPFCDRDGRRGLGQPSTATRYVGRTRWLIGSRYGPGLATEVADDSDLIGPMVASALDTGCIPGPEDFLRRRRPAAATVGEGLAAGGDMSAADMARDVRPPPGGWDHQGPPPF